mmetsp:Transcript_35214/g.35729  ORF Transcript_35214/g.35729 Transcript_35214/m.35729 type:complete len:128 (+) Transcript_35214:837-1220(+)
MNESSTTEPKSVQYYFIFIRSRCVSCVCNVTVCMYVLLFLDFDSFIFVVEICSYCVFVRVSILLPVVWFQDRVGVGGEDSIPVVTNELLIIITNTTIVSTLLPFIVLPITNKEGRCKYKRRRITYTH